jgi:hypothetical protein
VPNPYGAKINTLNPSGAAEKSAIYGIKKKRFFEEKMG